MKSRRVIPAVIGRYSQYSTVLATRCGFAGTAGA
jgi:hypothetical protein